MRGIYRRNPTLLLLGFPSLQIMVAMLLLRRNSSCLAMAFVFMATKGEGEGHLKV
jgi:hypothetical protein